MRARLILRLSVHENCPSAGQFQFRVMQICNTNDEQNCSMCFLLMKPRKISTLRTLILTAAGGVGVAAPLAFGCTVVIQRLLL